MSSDILTMTPDELYARIMVDVVKGDVVEPPRSAEALNTMHRNNVGHLLSTVLQHTYAVGGIHCLHNVTETYYTAVSELLGAAYILTGGLCVEGKEQEALDVLCKRLRKVIDNGEACKLPDHDYRLTGPQFLDILFDRKVDKTRTLLLAAMLEQAKGCSCLLCRTKSDDECVQ